MTAPTEATIATEAASRPSLTRREAVRVQEFLRKTGIPLGAVDHVVVKPKCVEVFRCDAPGRRIYIY